MVLGFSGEKSTPTALTRIMVLLTPTCFIKFPICYRLVVLTILKNMKVNGKDYPIYYGKYKMFETTNQSFISFMYGSPCPIFRQTELASCPLFPAAVMAHLRTHKWTLRAPDTKDFVVLGTRNRTRDGESIEDSWIYGIQMEKNGKLGTHSDFRDL